MQSYMDKKEFSYVNCAARNFCQKHYEFRYFKQYLKNNDIDLTKKTILDVGCGSGYSLALIMEEFQPTELFAFDALPQEIELARQRGVTSNLFVGNVVDILLPSDKFDAVFAFDVLHHVPEWRKALKEINRVLKNGGSLLLHEPRKKALDTLERFLKVHHPLESRFEWPELFAGLAAAGFRVIERRNLYLGAFQSCLCLKDR
jgi:ubiquinone/menaquinone biosynthesis C-methylase UbiE